MPAADLLLKSVARLLRPLIRLLIQSGVGFPVVSDMVRGLYVDVAQGLLTKPERTDSRLTLLTGVHRKEIRRLRLESGDRLDVPMVVSIGSQIIALWIGASETTDEQGQPLPLPRTSPSNGAPSFDGLVRAVTTDVRPRAVLDDWIAQGIATLDDKDQVRLNEAAFIPRHNEEALLFYFARNLHDHIASAAANVSATSQPPFLDRSVHYNHLSAEAAQQLEQISRDAAQRLLLEVNRAAVKLAEQDQGDGQTRRVNLGVYLFSADDALPDTTSNTTNETPGKANMKAKGRKP